MGIWDDVLEQLRREGFSKTDSIKATVERLGVSLAVAKDTVHQSAAWADVHTAHDGFHADLEAAARKSS